MLAETITITNDNVLTLYKVISTLPKDKGNVRFKYGILRNLKNIKPIVDSLNEVKKPNEAITKYQNDVIGLASKYCETNDKGLVLYTDETFEYVLTDGSKGHPKPTSKANKVKLEKELLKLREDNKIPFKEEKATIDAFNELLKEDVELDVYKISIDDVESIGELSYTQLSSLDFLIKDNDD